MFRKLFLSRTWHKTKLDRLSDLHHAIRTSILYKKYKTRKIGLYLKIKKITSKSALYKTALSCTEEGNIRAGRRGSRSRGRRRRVRVRRVMVTGRWGWWQDGHQNIRDSQAENGSIKLQQQSLQTCACLFMWKKCRCLRLMESFCSARYTTVKWQSFTYHNLGAFHFFNITKEQVWQTEDLVHIYKFNAFNPSTNVYLFFCSACNKWIKIKYNITLYFLQ